jgi:outer membrane protein assembly factor BamB
MNRANNRFSAILVAMCLILIHGDLQAEEWPGWRGPRGDGTSADTELPTHWTAAGGVKWKTKIPAGGHSSPITWGNRVFVVGAKSNHSSTQLNCDRPVMWSTT